jgi:hypothetical protein
VQDIEEHRKRHREPDIQLNRRTRRPLHAEHIARCARRCGAANQSHENAFRSNSMRTVTAQTVRWVIRRPVVWNATRGANISQLFAGMAVRQEVNFINSEKPQWRRKGSANIPRARAVTSKVRCVAINGALRKVAGAVKSRKQAIAIGLSKARKKGKRDRPRHCGF